MTKKCIYKLKKSYHKQDVKIVKKNKCFIDLE